MMSTQKAEALFDFHPTANVELKLEKGDVVVVRRMSVGEGWWEGEHNGKRGLFPSSFVKLLPIVQLPRVVEATDSNPTPPTPLTPRSSKKAFMETLLSPETSTLDEIYDAERASELFSPGWTDVSITVGPKWKGRPPALTIVVKEPQTESRFSGMKHVTLHQVETKELDASVSRRYKHFLWLYDRLAENFPCISLPPLPVKQASGTESRDLRRRGLERFLHNVARHPVLGCTRILKVFLTDEDSKHDKEWKIGKHLSHFSQNTKLPKTSRKLFHAPVYCSVKYPPYNVPISQLASIEKFSRFSRLLEMNVNNVHTSCNGLSMAQRDMVGRIQLLAKDLTCFVQGREPSTGAQRRKLQATVPVSQPPILLPNGSSTFYTPNSFDTGGAEVEEENSGGEEAEAGGASWNWREDEKFTSMIHELQDLSKGMQQTSRAYHTHQEAMESRIMESLQEYSGIINTLPGLVRLHEEAMEYYNFSKNKDTKKEAEEVRRNCETLNNILLAEFDYFSDHLVEHFEATMLRFLQQQAEFYRQMADEWDVLHDRYKERTSSRKSGAPIYPAPLSTSVKPPPSSSSHPHLAALLQTHDAFHRAQSTHLASASQVPGTERFSSQGPVTSGLHPLGMHTTLTISHSQPREAGSESGHNTAESDADSPCSTEATLDHNYVNLDARAEQHLASQEGGEEESRRLRSLSPLEQSIERALGESRVQSLDESLESDYVMVKPTSKREEEQKKGGAGGEETGPQVYANWQFAQMQERLTQSCEENKSVTAKTSIQNGLPKCPSKQHEEPAENPPPSKASTPPRKPIKPIFKSKHVQDSSVSVQPGGSVSPTPSPLTSEASPSLTKQPMHKSSSLSILQTEGTKKAKGATKQTNHLNKHAVEVDRFLPSQLTKPRSNTATNTLTGIEKKKPILPPTKMNRGSLVTQPHFPAMKEIVEVIQERREFLESSGEFDRSVSPSNHSSTQPSKSPRRSPVLLPRTLHASAAAAAAKDPHALSASGSHSTSRPLTLGAHTASKAPAKVSAQSSPTSELMRKLSLRRQKLDQQLIGTSLHTSPASSGGVNGSSRCTSTSSTQSELVCTYNVKRTNDTSPLESMGERVESGGGAWSGEEERSEGRERVSLREKGEREENLYKYGIEEDTDGGSYVI